MKYLHAKIVAEYVYKDARDSICKQVVQGRRARPRRAREDAECRAARHEDAMCHAGTESRVVVKNMPAPYPGHAALAIYT